MNSKQLLTAAVVGLSVTMSFVPATFASPNVQQTLNTQVNPSPQKVNIQQVIVVDEDKFRLVGAGDFRRRTIRIVPQAGDARSQVRCGPKNVCNGRWQESSTRYSLRSKSRLGSNPQTPSHVCYSKPSGGKAGGPEPDRTSVR